MNNNVITLNNFAVNNSTTTGVYWPELTSRTDFGAKLTPIYDAVTRQGGVSYVDYVAD